MRHTKYKVFTAWQYEKEEKWLNQMSAKGLQLVQVGFCKYIFEDSSKEKYIYRLEFLDNVPSNRESAEYISFLEETGIEYIGSVFRWVYLRKNALDGEFEIYSDVESKIKHYKRIMLLLIGVTPINVINTINSLIRYFESRESFMLWAGGICFALSILLCFGIFDIFSRIRGLKKEKLVRE